MAGSRAVTGDGTGAPLGTRLLLKQVQSHASLLSTKLAVLVQQYDSDTSSLSNSLLQENHVLRQELDLLRQKTALSVREDRLSASAPSRSFQAVAYHCAPAPAIKDKKDKEEKLVTVRVDGPQEGRTLKVHARDCNKLRETLAPSPKELWNAVAFDSGEDFKSRMPRRLRQSQLDRLISPPSPSSPGDFNEQSSPSSPSKSKEKKDRHRESSSDSPSRKKKEREGSLTRPSTTLPAGVNITSGGMTALRAAMRAKMIFKGKADELAQKRSNNSASSLGKPDDDQQAHQRTSGVVDAAAASGSDTVAAVEGNPETSRESNKSGVSIVSEQFGDQSDPATNVEESSSVVEGAARMSAVPDARANAASIAMTPALGVSKLSAAISEGPGLILNRVSSHELFTDPPDVATHPSMESNPRSSRCNNSRRESSSPPRPSLLERLGIRTIRTDKYSVCSTPRSTVRSASDELPSEPPPALPPLAEPPQAPQLPGGLGDGNSRGSNLSIGSDHGPCNAFALLLQPHQEAEVLDSHTPASKSRSREPAATPRSARRSLSVQRGSRTPRSSRRVSSPTAFFSFSRMTPRPPAVEKGPAPVKALLSSQVNMPEDDPTRMLPPEDDIHMTCSRGRLSHQADPHSSAHPMMTVDTPGDNTMHLEPHVQKADPQSPAYPMILETPVASTLHTLTPVVDRRADNGSGFTTTALRAPHPSPLETPQTPLGSDVPSIIQQAGVALLQGQRASGQPSMISINSTPEVMKLVGSSESSGVYMSEMPSALSPKACVSFARQATVSSASTFEVADSSNELAIAARSSTNRQRFAQVGSMQRVGTSARVASTVGAGTGLWENSEKPGMRLERQGAIFIDDDPLQLWPIWRFDYHDNYYARARQSKVRVTITRSFMKLALKPRRSMVRASSYNSATPEPVRMEDSALERLERRMTCMMVHPRHPKMSFWHLLGACLILYDVISIPLDSFALPELKWMYAMNWCTTCYWSADFILQFFLGFENELGQVEVRPRSVAAHYLRSWFLLDVFIVAFDWLSFLVLDIGGSSRGTRVSRALRAFRFVRVMRIVKLIALLGRVLDRVSSELVLVLTKVILLLLCVGFVAHYIGCYWYLLGDQNIQEDGTTWLSTATSSGEEFGSLYLKCLHWSLAQSSFVPIDIQATNTTEHLYTICIGFIWLIMIATTISQTTVWILQLRDANREIVIQETMIRKYLKDNCVSTDLCEEVVRYCRKFSQSRARRVHTPDIVIFEDLPLELRVSVHKQVFMPLLASHPLFEEFIKLNEAAVAAVCHLAMEEHYYRAGSEVFNHGDEISVSFFVVSGELEYYTVKNDYEPMTIGVYEWICEPVLWRKWECRGRLLAKSSSELVSLDANKFHTIMEDGEDKGWSVEFLRFYASEAASHFAQVDPHTDIWGFEYVPEIVAKAWEKAFSAGADPSPLQRSYSMQFGKTKSGASSKHQQDGVSSSNLLAMKKTLKRRLESS